MMQILKHILLIAFFATPSLGSDLSKDFLDSLSQNVRTEIQSINFSFKDQPNIFLHTLEKSTISKKTMSLLKKHIQSTDFFGESEHGNIAMGLISSIKERITIDHNNAQSRTLLIMLSTPLLYAIGSTYVFGEPHFLPFAAVLPTSWVMYQSQKKSFKKKQENLKSLEEELENVEKVNPKINISKNQRILSALVALDQTKDFLNLKGIDSLKIEILKRIINTMSDR